MASEEEAAQGVEEAWGYWLSQHPQSVPEIIESAAKKAFSEWLDRHRAEVIKAIADGGNDLPIAAFDGVGARARERRERRERREVRALRAPRLPKALQCKRLRPNLVMLFTLSQGLTSTDLVRWR